VRKERKLNIFQFREGGGRAAEVKIHEKNQDWCDEKEYFHPEKMICGCVAWEEFYKPWRGHPVFVTGAGGGKGGVAARRESPTTIHSWIDDKGGKKRDREKKKRRSL